MAKKKLTSPNIRMPIMTKNNLREFNQTEAQGWVIQRAIHIEENINHIIYHYFKPENSGQFLSIVLNSSIMHYGGKLKVLKSIGIDKSIYSKLQQLGSIRNAFAHTPLNMQTTYSYGDNEEATVETRDNISVMNSQGEIISKVPYEYLVEFLDLYNAVEPVLFQMFHKYRALNEKQKIIDDARH